MTPRSRALARRDAAGLLTAFGAPPARRALPAPTPHERVNRPCAPRRGPSRRGHGWAPVPAPLAVYRADTSEIGGLWPLLGAATVPAVGARIGYDALSGGAFYCHPVEWVLRGLVTNPNLVAFGEPGRGKSSTILAFLLRMTCFGVKALIAGDVKGEYTPVLRALGVEPIVLGAGHGTRLNALDLGPLRARWHQLSTTRQAEEVSAVVGRWVQLLVALAEAAGYTATPTDEMVLALVLRRLIGATDGTTDLRPVTLPDVHRLLAHPDRDLWTQARFADRRHLLDTTRAITDTLGNLIAGPLAGLFDDHTNFDLDWTAPLQSLDLERLAGRGDQAVAIALTLLGSWSALATDLREDGDLRLVLRDEVWRQMRLGLKAVQAVDADLRLSRRQQSIQVLVAHKPSDMLTVGAAGSAEVAIAKDLLSLCSTRILFGQSTRVADELADSLALGEREHQVVTGWAMERPGRALWKLEGRGVKVATVLSSVEKRIFDTNAQLRTPGGAGERP
ncbi:hypothetical protein GCM10012275_54010 [Longimycelium tulufanense]|uniref:ATP-binding protein n=1 Tax=Longimycelium tulufanense TaxID=907463 RepID=A0A8J3CHL4_9PSEU|nr:ATP-binding protein [Longimycelium tulufanense]GGM76421.1 hypothetical protein GCM10012275_54010 [Longimycelium tulufanense]